MLLCSCLLVCDYVSTFPHFSRPWQTWGVLVRCFGDGPSIWVCIWCILSWFGWSDGFKGRMCAQSLSCVRLFATPRTVAHQVPLSMEFYRQEYYSKLPFPTPGDLPDPGIKSTSHAVTHRFFTTEPPEKPGEEYLKVKCLSHPVISKVTSITWLR